MLQPIEMLYTSSPEGLLTPLRFRINLNDVLVLVKVKNPVIKCETRLNGIRRLVYKVNLIFVEAQTTRPDELQYEFDTCKWYIFNPNYEIDFNDPKNRMSRR